MHKFGRKMKKKEEKQAVGKTCLFLNQIKFEIDPLFKFYSSEGLILVGGVSQSLKGPNIQYT